MPEVIRGPFGRVGDGKGNNCPGTCDCCGYPMADMPAVIYIRTVTVMGAFNIKDWYVPLYKIVQPNQSCICGENNDTRVVEYWSMPFHFKRGAPNEFDMCCQIFGLDGGCTGNECVWRFFSYNPMLWEDQGDPLYVKNLTVPTEISCGTLEGSFHYIENDGSSGNQCVYRPLGVDQDITISQSVPGGTLADECHNMCCGQPLELYLTVNAPECPDIDGQVVTLSFIGAVMNQGGDGAAYNSNGTMTLYWKGKLLVPNGCPLTVTVTNNTWSGDTTAQCRWGISIGTGVFTCFEGDAFENDKSFCPPITFSGTWNQDTFDQCDMCCLDLAMTFDLDL